MSKSVTVQFDDGTSHVYDDVPDHISDSEVESRASQEFGKEIAHVGTPIPHETNMGEKAVGALQTGVNLAGQALGNPLVQYGLEAGGTGLAAKKFLVDPLVEAMKAGRGPVNPAAMEAGAQQAAQATGTGGAQAFNQMGNQLKDNTIKFSRGKLTVTPSTAAPAAEAAAPAAEASMGQRVMQAAAPAAGMAALPAAMSMPYAMAAQEQAKIRQNPSAPGLQYNPYAQQVRGEAATQGQAGAANQMRATANMPYGNVSPEERAMLNADAVMRQNIRKKAYEKVMGPVAPGQMQ